MMGAAGAGACVAVFAGEAVGADSAATADVGGEGTIPATSQFVTSIAAGVEIEGRK